MYGKLPEVVDTIEVDIDEMFSYTYLPIKFPGSSLRYEKRLYVFDQIIFRSCNNFISNFGNNRYYSSYVYLTAKNLYQKNGSGFNRPGLHSDGFLSDDISYIWSNTQPTIFSNQPYNLSRDDQKSLEEMEKQYVCENDITYPNNSLIRLDQYVIHKVASIQEGLRCFVKICFSKDKYDLKGNSHNYEFEYDWKMRERNPSRNVPQELL